MTPPLVAHVIFAFRMGGLENGLVNIINRMAPDKYRHAVICLTGHDAFAERVERPDVPVVDLHKRPGQDIGLHGRLWKIFRRLRPAIVHTRNFAALEAHLPAALAGVRHRVHGEHGRDVFDLHYTNRKQRLARRLLNPLVDHYVALSEEMEAYLREQVRVGEGRLTRICNGVDSARFSPGPKPPELLAQAGFPAGSLVVGYVGRMEDVKDPLDLVRAFIDLIRRPDAPKNLRLALVGEGSLSGQVQRELREAGLLDRAWLPGPRQDVAAVLRLMDLFVLPSLAEGISNTLLESMATGLPAVATAVGGNKELIADGETGTLVPPADPQALADAIADYAHNPERLARHGTAARRRVEENYSLDIMVENYTRLYDSFPTP